MGKQKVVIKLRMNRQKSRSKALQIIIGVLGICLNRQKSRSKALEIIVSAPGIKSFAVKDNDQVELIGEGIDTYELIKRLKKTKNVDFVELVSVTPIDDQKKPEKSTPSTVSVSAPVSLNSYSNPLYMYDVRDNGHDPLCSIL
ncbi:hypothetical protein U1Q18_001000 [Sarracenia purpurea var. burkii]